MSSRVLRKLQGDKDLPEEISDPDTDLPVAGGARRKQFNINRYDLLNQQSLSESEVKEDDNETEANNANEGDETHESTKRRKKKKKKKSGKHSATHRSSEDNTEMDEVERSVREVNRLLGENYMSGSLHNSDSRLEKNILIRKNILSIQHKHLNPNNELKRIFGSKIIQTEHKRKNRGGVGRGHLRTSWLVSPKDNWPPIGKHGLSMALLETKQGIHHFTYEHSQSYRQIQHKFLEAVESLNPDNLVAIINEHPYHIDALIQLSDLCRLSEDLAMAADLIERALYALECAFHPFFNIAQGNGRLDYKRQENRAMFITLFKHLQFVGGRACYRTALEVCKLLLSLDPEGDPLAVKLIIDFYALRAKEYKWLIDFAEEWETSKNLSQLPNFAFSVPIAIFHTSGDDTKKADSLLQDALIMFPGLLKPLMDKCSICPDSRVEKSEFFSNTAKQPAALTQLINLYVNRSYHLWKEPEILPWLERNVNEVLDRVAKGDKIVKDYEQKRLKRYQGPMPLSISRHVILSDVKGVSPLAEDFTAPVLSFDPLPPPDSVNIYSKSLKPKPSSQSTIGLFFRSIIPNFEDFPRLPLPQDGAGDEDGARALPEREANNATEGEDLRRSVASLVGAVRDLLSNLRLPDVPNDADVDENDDSEDDEPNYLT
ncbi:transcription factor 25 [Agrilus planipennis]|uniref:Transcription factor 25 n=1 Tax=Agrilus planipennis TaxID=224129 RepID=A0A1W4XHG8_AGRPL|nr:transcription factor 25 [Agrilus planipennis]